MAACEVLIAGAGPVGLFLACELRRRGRSCIIVESRAAPSQHSKALALMPRTFEIFEMAGLRDAFAAAVNPVRRIRFSTARSSAVVGFEQLPTRYPFVGIVPQWQTEAILAARLRELGTPVRYAERLESFVQQPEGIAAQVVTENGRYEIAARYLVGCDGVRSAVRERAGIDFEGNSYPDVAYLADLPMRTEVPPDEARVHVGRREIVTLFPMRESIRRMVVITTQGTAPESIERDGFERRLADAGIDAALTGDPSWSNAFRVHRRIARSMRAGNVFIAGDAAHAQSPVGGQGMNVGLHDAWNLGWKLAQVLAGEASEDLLKTYEIERLPVARDVVARTDALSKLLAHPHPLMRVARELLAPLVAFPAIRDPLVRRLSQLEVPYAKSMPDVELHEGGNLYAAFPTSYAIVTQSAAPLRPLRVPGCTEYAARGEDGRECVLLVRPDGYIAFEAPLRERNALAERLKSERSARNGRAIADRP